MYPFNWRPETGLKLRPPGSVRRLESPTPTLRVDCADVIDDAKAVVRQKLKEKPRKLGVRASWAEKVSRESSQLLQRKAEEEAAATAKKGALAEVPRPASAGTHMKSLQNTVRSYALKAQPCDEYHRYWWFHRSTLHPPTEHRGPEAKIGLGRREKIWGGLASDYGRTNMEVEKHHLLNSISDTEAESGAARKAKHRLRTNRSLQSLGVTTCLTGGSHVAMGHTAPAEIHFREYRQRGLYEESFPHHAGKNYQVPDFGLPSTDVTRVEAEIQKQIVVMRPR